jgi:NAD(P)-dependent dehydrogenase (short-subunit alcohol dehydrogenase family)
MLKAHMQPEGISARPVAIVTGAARGIGRGVAVALGRAGFQLLLNDLDGAEQRRGLEETAAELAALGAGSLCHAADIGNLETHGALTEAAIARWGRLDCLVNNAGVSVLHRGDLLEATPESFDRCWRINTRAVFFLSQAAARRMIEQGEIGRRHRSIINITSSNAIAVAVRRGEYCVSKAASSMTTRLFAVRLAGAGIGVYEIRPGLIETEMTRPVKAMYDELVASPQVPAHRWGQPEDVAAAVCALAEGRLRYSTGEAVAVDGGLTLLKY